MKVRSVCCLVSHLFLTHQQYPEVGRGVHHVCPGVKLQERHHHQYETVGGEAAGKNLKC